MRTRSLAVSLSLLLLFAGSTLAEDTPGSEGEEPRAEEAPATSAGEPGEGRTSSTNGEQSPTEDSPPSKGEELETEIDQYLHTLPEVVVQGTVWSGLPIVPIEEPRSHDVLSPVRVENITITTYEEVVKRLPGVTSRLYSGDEYLRPSISLRGMPDNGFTEYSAVLVDGINMSTLFYGWTAISIFPFTPERIYAAEVIRGGHAVRYGPNTIGGIVNVISRPVPFQLSLRESVVYGSYDYHSTVTEFGGPVPGLDLGFLLTFVEKGGDSFREDARFDINEISLKGYWDLGPKTRLDYSIFHWRDVHEQPGRLTRAQFREDRTQNPNPTWADWHGWAYGVTMNLRHEINADDWVQGYAYYRLARRALDSARPRNGPPYDTERSADSDMINEGVGVEGEVSFDLGTKHLLHYGARLHRETIHRKTFQVAREPGGTNDFTQNADSENVAISLNVDDTVRLGDLTLNAGVRFEHLPVSEAHDRITDVERDFDMSGFFPGASVSYRFDEHFSVFANGNASFRAPQTWSYDFSEKKQDLDFETGANYELGTRISDLEGWSGSLVLWYVDFTDFIQYDPDLDVYDNLGAYQSQGIDLAFEIDAEAAFGGPVGLSLFGTTTWQRSEFDKGENRGEDTPFVPKWSANGGVYYQHPTGFYGSLELNYWGGASISPTSDIDTPGFTTFDFRAGFRKTLEFGESLVEIDVAATVKNLFDKDVYLIHREDSYVPGAPREFFGSVSLTLRF